MLYYLLSDHLDVFEALHAADVIDQDVGVGVTNPQAAEIHPLLNTHTHTGTEKQDVRTLLHISTRTRRNQSKRRRRTG